MAFIAMLFVLTPSLEAMACAAEGCDRACLEQSEGETISDAGDISSDGCAEKNCVCAAGHCGHVAVSVLDADVATVLKERSTERRISVQNFVSAASRTLERPPRI